MRRKLLYTFLVAALSLTHTSCEDFKDEYLDEFSTILYLRNSGEVPLTLYKTGENTNYTIIVNKTGSNTGAVTCANISVMEDAAVEIYNSKKGTSYKKLPANCYNFEKTQVQFSGSDLYKILSAEFKTNEISKLPVLDNGTYVLPIELSNSVDSINSSKNVLFVSPQVVIPKVSFNKTGYQSNTISDEDDEVMSLELPISLPFDSQWAFDCTVEIDEELLEKYNQENGTNLSLLPAGCYEMNTKVSFTPGVNSQSIVVKVNQTKLGLSNYALPLVLSNITNENFLIDTKKNSCIFGVKQTIKLTEKMLETNALEPTEGALRNLLDGDIATMFHSAWSVPVDGDHYVQVNLKKEISMFSFTYTTRKENGNAAPTEIIISGSKDGKTFTDITTINEGLPLEGSQQYISKAYTADFSFKHLRFIVTKSKSGKCFVWSEFSLSGK